MSRSTWTTLAPGSMSAPSRVVQRVSEAPKASTRSDAAISRAATGEAKPPEIPTAHGDPAKSPWPIAEVASTAPMASPSASSASRAPANTAPRPAMMTGRRLAAISSATSATASPDGAGACGAGAGERRRRRGARLRLDVERHAEQDRPALHLRAAQRPRDVVRRARPGVHALGRRADGRGQRRLVEPEVRAQRRGGRLAGQQQQRGAGLGRLGEARHRVGEAGSLMDAADADAPAHARVAVRHADRPALVAGVVERRARRVQGLGGDEVPAAQHSERVADAERRQRAADDLGGGQRLHRRGP